MQSLGMSFIAHSVIHCSLSNNEHIPNSGGWSELVVVCFMCVSFKSLFECPSLYIVNKKRFRRPSKFIIKLLQIQNGTQTTIADVILGDSKGPLEEKRFKNHTKCSGKQFMIPPLSLGIQSSQILLSTRE
jgi:hypothetical protein